MAVTLKEVAARAGVSRSAVSRTFTQGASVSPKTRAKVEQAARDLGYSPSALASALSTGRTKLVGLIVDNFHNPFYLAVFDQFTRALQDRGLRPLLINLTDETDPAQSVRLLTQYSVDGVIVASSTLAPGFATAFRAAGLPVVHSFGRIEASPQIDVVTVDNVASGRMAAETLLARGYRRLGFLGGPAFSTSTQDRYAGFADGVRGQRDASLIKANAQAYTFEAGRQAMQRHLEAPGAARAEAYFCADDVLSLGALSAARDHGIAVPNDLGILGFDDIEIAGWQSMALTTIHQPVDAIIASSVARVVALLDAPEHAPTAQAFPCRIVERATLRPLP